MRRTWLLVAIPVLLRVALVPLVDDFDADGYSRTLIAHDLANAVRAGSATWSSLYVAVWPPAWAVLCAGADLLGADPYVGAKLLSALFGGLTPLLVFCLARALGADRRGSLWAWGLAAFAPLHVLYSASAMSEAFYGFLFVLALVGLVRAERGNSWLLVTGGALLVASLTRFDVWILLPAIPVLAVVQRRASWPVLLGATALCAAGPLLWGALNLEATGDAIGFTRVHGDYVRHLLQFHPVYADRGPLGWGLHLLFILSATGLAVGVLGVLGAIAATRSSRNGRAVVTVLALAFAWLLVLWLARRQIGWRRHYLAIGSALAALAPLALAELSVSWRRRAVALMVFDLAALGAVDVWMTRAPRREREAAAYVAPQSGLVYSDDPGVAILGGLPPERVVNQSAIGGTPEAALADLRHRGVRWVVFADVDWSPLPELFPGLRAGRDAPPFRLADAPQEIRPLPRIFVYELM